MEVVDKIVAALRTALRADYIRLDNDDGISGFVVSPLFEDMTTLERQEVIDEALRKGNDALKPEELQRILMIAGLTPKEYEAAGSRITVHRIRELGDGSLEVLLHGGYSDAKYVRGALNNQKGIETSEPEPSPGAVGVLMTFRAKGTGAQSLSKERAIQVLEADQHIKVLQDA